MNLADDDEKNLLSSLVATLLFLTEDFFDFGLTSLTNVHYELRIKLKVLQNPEKYVIIRYYTVYKE